MLRTIRKVEQVFKQLDKHTKKFTGQSKLRCLTNCNRCCLKKGLEASVLEFLPFAYYLVTNNLHEKVLDLLETEPEFCINLAKNPAPGITAGCAVYEHRGLICRLFGFSAVHDKNDKLSVYTCHDMKTEFPKEFKYASDKINSGMNIPIVTDYYFKFYFIDNQMANDYNSINVSIRKAIEKVAYYYANKPVRKPGKKVQPIVEL